MWSHARSGWTVARRSWFLLFILFLYQYGWGFALYKYAKSAVVPLLHRYPGGELPEAAGRLFWLEAEFQLTKTSLAAPYLWTLGAILLVRMLAAPLINAGLYNVLARRSGGQRRAFAQGVRQYAKPFLLLYGLQTLLTLAPLPWAAARALEAASAATGWTGIAAALLPCALGWLAYQGALDLAFMHIGFGIVEGDGVRAALGAFVRRLIPIFGLALAVFGIALAAGLTVAALSLWWAGFFAVLLHQSYPLVRCLLKLWGISAQYELWSARRA